MPDCVRAEDAHPTFLQADIDLVALNARQRCLAW